MSTGFSIGLDFGSLSYRAAYLLEHGIVSIPMHVRDPIWSGLVIAHRDPSARPLGVDFLNLKSILGTRVTINGRELSAGEVVRVHLAKIREAVVTFAGEDVTGVVVAVPASYSAYRRAALRQFAQEAGFQCADLVNDCFAAALGHTFGREKPSTLLTYSLGYHAFECSVLHFDGRELRELAHGDSEVLSAKIIDAELVAAVLAIVERQGVSLPLKVWPADRWLRILGWTARLKESLTAGDETAVELPSHITDAEPLQVQVPAASLDQIVAPIAESSMRIVERTLDDAGVKETDIDEVLLVGGSTRLNSIQRRLEAVFGAKLIQPRDDLVARGAAVEADRIAKRGSRAEGTSKSDGATAKAGPALEGARREAPVPPDLEPVFNFANQLITLGRVKEAEAFLDALAVRTRIMLAQIRSHKATPAAP